MQCGSCIGKHMKGNSGINMSADLKYMPIIDREKDAMKKGDVGGPKIMGGDGKKKPMEKIPSAQKSRVSNQIGFADKIGGMIKQNMAGTGSPDLSLNTATYAMNKAFNKAQDLKKEGPFVGVKSSVSSKYAKPKSKKK